MYKYTRLHKRNDWLYDEDNAGDVMLNDNRGVIDPPPNDGV